MAIHREKIARICRAKTLGMNVTMAKIALVFLIILTQLGECKAQGVFPYAVKLEVPTAIRSQLDAQLQQFRDLMQKQKSSEKRPVLGGVVADVGCSISLRKKMVTQLMCSLMES